MDNKVWIILRPHYSPKGNLEKLGVCGTGFFINKNTFITSYHILNQTSFFPNSNYFNDNIFIINPAGKKIEIKLNEKIKFLPEIDTTILKIEGSHDFFESTNALSEKDSVENIGYPERDIKEILNSQNLLVKKQFKSSGKILKIIPNYFMNANDVKIFDKKVIVLNYTSEKGFSRGPLLKNNKVIGIMSHLYPQNKNAIAITIEEIKKYL